MKVLTLILLFFVSFTYASQWENAEFSIEENSPVILLNDGPESLRARIDLIRSAKKTIDIEYFIFSADLAGKIILDELIKKAKEGVRVRVLGDAFNVSKQITPFHIAILREKGVDFRYFNLRPLYQATGINYRNHRKLFIIDSKYYITGGRNIADEYFDLDTRYNFLDRDILVSGKSVSKITKNFEQFWKSPLTKEVKEIPRPRFKTLKNLRGNRSRRSMLILKYRAKLRRWKEAKNKAIKFFYKDKLAEKALKNLYKRTKKIVPKKKLANIWPKTLRFLADQQFACQKLKVSSDLPLIGGRANRSRRLKYELFRRIGNTQENLTLDSPYFVMTNYTMKLFRSVLDKEVSTTLLTNGVYSSDNGPVSSVFNHYVEDWVSRGLKVTIFGGKREKGTRFLIGGVNKSRWGTHSKTIVFDNESTMIGTYNLDPRSANYSFEISVFCDESPELASAVRQNVYKRQKLGIFFKTKEDARKHAMDNVPMFKRIMNYVIRPFSLIIQGLL